MGLMELRPYFGLFGEGPGRPLMDRGHFFESAEQARNFSL
jgi:hypothetical protein